LPRLQAFRVQPLGCAFANAQAKACTLYACSPSWPSFGSLLRLSFEYIVPDSLHNRPEIKEHLKPEGLSDSSRWSERSADHRNEARFVAPWRGATVFLPPFQGGNFRLRSGGLHYAPTTGYYLTALQAETAPATARLAVRRAKVCRS